MDAPVTKYIYATICDIDCKLEADNGSDINLFPKNYFVEFCQKLGYTPKLQKTTKTIKACNKSVIKTLGWFSATITSRYASLNSKIYVMDQNQQDLPLLSRYDLFQLGYIKVDPDGAFAAKKVTSVQDISDSEFEEKVKVLHQKFKNVFIGVGTYKHHVVDLQLKEDAEPFIIRAIPCPIHLRDKAIKRLEYFVKSKILEPVENGYPIEYCSPLLVIMKPHKDEVRFVCNFKRLNSSLIRSRHVPAVGLHDFQRVTRGFKYFFTLDCKDSFHQLKMSKRSQDLTIISTFAGCYRWKKLPQGLNISQDHWDHVMQSVLASCTNTISMRDDILGGGVTKSACLAEYEKVLTAIQNSGITCDPTKRQVGLKKISFFGMVFTSEGMSPDPKKVDLIKNAKPPTSKEELNSFVCMCMWNDCFIPRYAEIVRPLRDLVSSKEKFVWLPKHESAFNEVKQKLAKHCMNNHFVEGRATYLFTDAGKKSHNPENQNGGFAAILAQKDKDDKLLTIAYSSRSISPVEAKWGQCELEARALRYGVDKWRHYFTGITKLYCYVDCKPLVSIWNNHSKTCPPRIDRQRLATQDIPMEVIHLPGSKNPADFGSRARSGENDANVDDLEDMECSDELDMYLVRQIHAIDKSINDKNKNEPIAINHIREITNEDKELQFVKQRIMYNDWTKWKKHPLISPYFGLRNEFSIIDEMVIRGSNSIVLPTKLRKRAISLVHNLAHSGETNTISLLRTRFWFPKCTPMIENEVKNCSICKHTTKSTRKEPSGITPTPTRCFSAVNCDFKGPFHDAYYVLVFLDQFSKYPEIYFTKSEAFKSVKCHFDTFISNHGQIDTLRSDNGPPFNGEPFKEYLKSKGIKHLPTIPETPWTNECEQFMRNIRKAYDIARLKGWDYKEFMRKMILVKRATPNPTTKVSPHFAVTGRTLDPGILRGKLPFDHEPSGLTKTQNEEIQERIKQGKVKTMERHNKKKNTVHLELKPGDTVLVRLGDKKYPEKEEYVVTEIKNSRIAAKNKTTGRVVERHLTRFVKLQNPEKNLEDSEKEVEGIDEGIDVPYLPINTPRVEPLPGRNARNGQNQRARRGRRNVQPQGELPRATRQLAARTGVPPPDISNVQPTTLERSVRARADATDLMDQYRHDLQEALERERRLQRD